ncbi:substrate-binding domain-containing protein [Herminiimonas glaciei]|uniref:Substrate-binding domain-containing protein n=1 Tax=Herminiimonas glaciei TaxID=523788 RepID=A0ABW2I737_9BURK
MSFSTKHVSSGIAAVALVCATSLALAAPTVCTVVPSGSPYDATIAVASNFYGPAQNLVTDFTAAGKPGAGKRIRICHNATADLNTEIRTGTSGYSLFLAANASTPNGLVGTTYVQSGATSDLYAKGIPVLFARSATVSSVKTLIPALPNGASANVSFVATPAFSLSTANSQTVAVADPVAAPYGNAAVTILADMGHTVSSSSIPAWVNNPLYGNISLTFDAVATSPFPNKSGFVSKAQICDGVAPASPVIYTYVAFTNAKYVLNQNGILIDSGNAGQNALGASLRTFMLANSDPNYWSGFLSTHCYAPI